MNFKKKKDWLMKFWITLSEHNLKDTNYGSVPNYGTITLTNTDSCPDGIRYHPPKEFLAIYEDQHKEASSKTYISDKFCFDHDFVAETNSHNLKIL